MNNATPDMTDRVRTGGMTQAEARGPEDQARPNEPQEHHGRQWTGALPQVATEHSIDIGDGRYAHFRRDRRYAQVQVAFTAPQGVDANPGRELTDQFKELGWTWRPKLPGKPWTYQLEKSSADDPTARGDSRDALHEQFVIIIQEYREKHGMPPINGWPSLADNNTKAVNADRYRIASCFRDDQARLGEDPVPQSPEGETRAGASLGMLDAFASVGAERFDLTFTDAAGEKISFQGNRPLDQLRSAIPGILQQAAERQENVIVRPRSAGTALIQLDDLGEQAVERLRPVSFLVLRTSPGSYQAWVAVADADADFTRLLRKGVGADLTASGATRVSGSLNVKDKYAPAFPRVETVHASSGRVVTRADLEALGMVAPPERTAPPAIRSARHTPDARGWPSYERCLEGAPEREPGQRDRSRADFTFCLLAIDWGWGVEVTAARLMQESGKAQENGETYALRTAAMPQLQSSVARGPGVEPEDEAGPE